jgi:predicted Zn finger-like uncharacterized protein
MSLVTKCPSCFTSFIVKPKQLEAHRGKVRCGQCQHVFIARDYLQTPNPQDDFLPAAKPSAVNQKKPLILALYASLFLLALFQAVFFLRSEIAKQWPTLKPTITKTCQLLNCTLPLPQHAELIAIDDTELIKDETDAGIVKFNCLIINNASYTQSFPSIELTLTDKQDMPLIRRKITPNEYLNGSNANPNDGLAGNDEIHLSLNLKTADMPVTGFRAFIVY